MVGVHIRTHVSRFDIKLPDFETGATWADVSPVELFIKVHPSPLPQHDCLTVHARGRGQCYGFAIARCVQSGALLGEGGGVCDECYSYD